MISTISKSALRALWVREMRSTFQAAKFYWSLALLVLLIAGALAFQLNMLSIMEAASLSRSLIGVFTAVLAGGAFLLMPPYSAACLAVERERDCLDMLLAAPISHRDIVLAKFFAALTFYGFYIIATLPIVGVVFFLVGIDWMQLATSLFACILMAMACAAIGLHAAAGANSVAPAVMSAYARCFVLLIIIPQFCCGFASPAMLFFVSAGSSFNPFGWVLGIIPTAFILLLTAYFLSMASHKLGRGPKAPKPVAPLRVPLDAIGLILLPSRCYAHPAVQMRHRPPLAGKGVSDRVFVYRAALIFMLLMTPYILGPLGIALSNVNMALAPGRWFTFLAVLGVLWQPVLVATQVTRDHERETMIQLRTTLLKPYQLVLGQLASAFLAYLPFMLGAALSCVILLWGVHGRAVQIGITFAGFVLFTLAVLAASQFAALWFRSSIRALVAAYTAALALGFLCMPLHRMAPAELLALAVGTVLLVVLAIPLFTVRHFRR